MGILAKARELKQSIDDTREKERQKRVAELEAKVAKEEEETAKLNLRIAEQVKKDRAKRAKKVEVEKAKEKLAGVLREKEAAKRALEERRTGVKVAKATKKATGKTSAKVGKAVDSFLVKHFGEPPKKKKTKKRKTKKTTTRQAPQRVVIYLNPESPAPRRTSRKVPRLRAKTPRLKK